MKKLAILGAAESGVGTAILAQKQGWDVFVSDFGSIKEEYKETLNRHNLRWEEGHHTEEEILSADAVVKSPGIPDTAPIVQRLIEKGTPILAELEFARQYSRGKTICITGSNGKTTTTRLIYYIMQRWGVDVGLAGNIGRSYAAAPTPCRWPKAITTGTCLRFHRSSWTTCSTSALTFPS